VLQKLGDLVQDASVVAGIGDEEDGALRTEVALFASQSTFCGLNVVDAGLRFHDCVKRCPFDVSVGAPQIAWNRHLYLGAPPEGWVEPGPELSAQSELSRIPDRGGHGVDPHAQFTAEHGG